MTGFVLQIWWKCWCSFSISAGTEESVATFKGNEFFCYDLSMTPIQSSTDEITLSFRTLQRNGLMLHTGKSADYVNLSLKSGAVWLVINLGSGAFEALVEPVNGKFNDNAWHDVKVTRNLRQVRLSARFWNAFAWIVITNRCAGRRESLWNRTSLTRNDGLRSTVLPNDCSVIPDRSGSSGVCVCSYQTWSRTIQTHAFCFRTSLCAP